MLKPSRCPKQVVGHLARCARKAQHIPITARRSSSIPERAAFRDEPDLYPRTRPHQRGPNATSRWNLTSESTTKPDQAIGRDEQVVTSSLEETLHSHRDYNAESVKIRKINSEHKGDSYLLQAVKHFPGVKHVALEREAAVSNAKWQDYAAEARSLTSVWAISDDMPRSIQQPWTTLMNREVSPETTGVRRLNSEVKAANHYFSPSPEEARAASVAFADVRRVAKDIMSCVSKVDLIGSRQSQLSDPLSDLDVNLVLKDDSPIGPTTALSRLYHRLRFVPAKRRHQQVLSPGICVLRARVPLVTLRHVQTGLECQIQCASSGYGSLEVARGLRAELPSIEPLFRIVRQMLRMRGLCDGRHGGLTSYPILIMIATSLKLHANKSSSDHVGQQLLDFLKFYSETNFYSQGITYLPSQFLNGVYTGPTREMLARDGVSQLVVQDPVGSIPVLFDVRKHLRDVHKARHSFQMVLHDPANLYNDLGLSAYLIKHVQETFRIARDDIMRNMSAYEETLRTGIAADSKLSLLAPILGGDYSLFQLNRSRLTAAVEPDSKPADHPDAGHNDAAEVTQQQI